MLVDLGRAQFAGVVEHTAVGLGEAVHHGKFRAGIALWLEPIAAGDDTRRRRDTRQHHPPRELTHPGPRLPTQINNCQTVWHGRCNRNLTTDGGSEKILRHETISGDERWMNTPFRAVSAPRCFNDFKFGKEKIAAR